MAGELHKTTRGVEQFNLEIRNIKEKELMLYVKQKYQSERNEI